MVVEEHFRQTESLVRAIQPEDIGLWLLEEGYYPEQYVLPPSFSVDTFKLNDEPLFADLKDLSRRQALSISYPKTELTTRDFGLIDPRYYHDIVRNLVDEWDTIVDLLFHTDQQIYSYSFPIPVSADSVGTVGSLRAGRMIYEWLRMAETDIITDSGEYSCILKSDITNFYGSIYTHAIAWALHGKPESRSDNDFSLLGNRIDRILQQANDGMTHGILVGSALSDLIAETVLSRVDLVVSRSMKKLGVNFIATRFKDDYRFLCRREEDAREILRGLSETLRAYGLTLNEKKSDIYMLPDGLYRPHDREYFPHSLQRCESVPFRDFEHTLLIVLDLHRKYGGTSIIEKFIWELIDRKRQLKLEFDCRKPQRERQILKTLTLLKLCVDLSAKSVSSVMVVWELLYRLHADEVPSLKGHLIRLIEGGVTRSSRTGSTFLYIWYLFFSRYLGFGIQYSGLVRDGRLPKEPLRSSIERSKQVLFNQSGVQLFRKPKECRDHLLVEHLEMFLREEPSGDT